MIYAVSGTIYTLFSLIFISSPTQAFVTVSCILAAILGIISPANGGVLCYNTIKSDVRTRTKVKQYVWAALCVAYFVFIIGMQLYCFILFN